MTYTRIAALRTADDFRAHLAALGITLPFDEKLEMGKASSLAKPIKAKAKTLGNSFAVLPMEGWDGTLEGHPSDLTLRRWRRFGQSGAKLIWGGEAVAIRHDGRANPNQLVANETTLSDLAKLREALLAEHQSSFGRADDLLIGLQLTHSGRFARPNGKTLEPRTLYRHPWLDAKFRVPPEAVLSDDDVRDIIAGFGSAARIAQQAGFEFIDLKHCHGYLGHEFLSAHDRPGDYGGSFENRTRFLRETVEVIRAAAPGMQVGVRLSAFDWMPFRPGANKVGVPDAREDAPDYRYAFGGDGTGLGIDLREPHQFLDELEKLGIELVCITAGSPYYNPHIQRPALFPPSDGYLPPEDPLVGVARQIHATHELKRKHPNLIFVGTGYSYLQDWLPNVAQAVLRQGWVDSVGLGRMVLTYPEMLADALEGKALQRKRICRTFSDCTTGPRNHLVSGCYPLDDYYKNHPHKALLEEAKQK
jgi:2,4-dienoyl-CoA reductase-like NADH-dependent reductase (Old Yellow Enzyme family)